MTNIKAYNQYKA